MTGPLTGSTSRRGGTRPPEARTSRAAISSSSMVSSGGGPRSTVTTQSWQCSPRTTQVSQSILVVMSRTVTGATDIAPGAVDQVAEGELTSGAARHWRIHLDAGRSTTNQDRAAIGTTMAKVARLNDNHEPTCPVPMSASWTGAPYT